jgi:hypothetical protein
LADNVAHDIDGTPQQRHRGLGRAEGGVRRQRDVRHVRQRMIVLERLVVKHVESGVTNAAAGEPIEKRRLIDQGGARRIDHDHTRLHARDVLRPDKSARLVAEREIERDRVGTRQQFVERDERIAGTLRAVPGDDVHAKAAADPHDLAPDAAEPDHAERLAEELHALVRHPGAGAHLAIHARDIAA